MRNIHVLATAFALFLTMTLGGFAASVKVTVNGMEITDLQISARAALLRLERRGNTNNDRLQKATDELIDEAVMLSEAERIGISVPDDNVEAAYLTVARNTKLSADKLDQFLLGSGSNPQTLKDRLRANIAWNSVANIEIAPQVNVSDLQLEQEAQDQIEDSLSYDYILKEVRFIVPQGSKVSVSQRTAQADQYRKNFQGCASAVDLSLAYTDVAVIDIGRRHATQFPEALSKELAGLNVGGITKPRVAEGGVSMLAVCAKASARDTTFIKNELRQEAGNTEFQDKVSAFLKTLRDRATIVYR